MALSKTLSLCANNWFVLCWSAVHVKPESQRSYITYRNVSRYQQSLQIHFTNAQKPTSWNMTIDTPHPLKRPPGIRLPPLTNEQKPGTNKSFASTQSKRHNKWSIEAAAPIQALQFCFSFCFLTCIRHLYGCALHQHRTPRPSSFARLRYGSLNLLIFLKICTFRAWNWTYFANAEHCLSCIP